MGEGFEAVSVKDNTERGSITSVGDNVISEADSSEVNALGLNNPAELEKDETDMMARGIISPCSQSENGSWDFPRWKPGNGLGDQGLLAYRSDKSNEPKFFGSPPSDNTHTWKLPGQDDNYHGWKPGDTFDSKDLEGWRESVRSYVGDFMHLNGVNVKTPEGEMFRNAFQHELAAAAFVKQAGIDSHSPILDVVGVGNEAYQAIKDSFDVSPFARTVT